MDVTKEPAGTKNFWGRDTEYTSTDNAIDRWVERKKICILGAGMKPLRSDNKDEFLGLEDVQDYEALNIDRIKYSHIDLVRDLSEEKWYMASNQFDIVIAEHLIEHLPNRISAIRECMRIVKPKGLVIIETPNWCHETAHSNLEHLTTWSRMIFDDSYVNHFGADWDVEKVVYRITNPITWNSHYIKWEFLGRQIDRFTPFISGLRFYLRKP